MSPKIANVEMAAAWDGDEGTDWARDWQRYDSGIRGYHERLLKAAAITAGERILDVGCGNGESTRDAARAAKNGTALGVDLSSKMLARARERAEAEGLTNARFERADAQVHPFPEGTYDVVISRFGAMFFGDPVAAFTNLASATRSGGRLALVAWQRLSENEWLQTMISSLAVGRDLPGPPVGAPGPFGLADPDQVRGILAAAGYADVAFEELHLPFLAGADAADAFGFLRCTGAARGLLGGLDEEDRASALEALRAAVAGHETSDGVVFGSGVWLITATKP